MKSGLFYTLTWGHLCPIPYTFLTKQSHFRHRSQKEIAIAVEQSKEVTFANRLANVRTFASLVVRGLYCPFSQKLIKKALHEITVNSQG